MIVRITSRFNEVSQLHPTGHTGVDIGIKEGTPLRSVYDGVIEKVYDGSTNIGEGVMVRFEDGTQGIYGHMSQVNVKVGQQVQDGQILGLSGNTGRSTGEHLHFAIKENGEFIDPTPLVEQTVNHESFFSKILDYDFPTIGDFLYDKIIGVNIEQWVSDYIMALPVLLGVSVGVWGLLSMVNKTLASWGVGLVMVLGGLMVI